MAEQRLVLCGGTPPGPLPRPWQHAQAVPLRLGRGRSDVHLMLSHVTRPMAARLPAAAVDLLELAAYVYAADQAVGRGGRRQFEYGDRWRRHFRFEVPVRCPEVWVRPGVAAALAGVLGFLSDDDYEFAFRRLRNPPPLEGYLFEAPGRDAAADCEEVVLFSGGLDSLAGAVQEVLHGQRKVALVSHRPVSKVYARQCALADRIARRLPRPALRPLHVAVVVNKGRPLGRDFNQRSRSFLFAAVAAVVARLFGLARVRFYENGVTSLNLPLSPQVVGGRASRTTHPRTLAGFGRLFGELFGVRFEVDNPFRWDTKTTVLNRLKASGHGDLCALACSCGHTVTQTSEHPHCGRCSQCVDRRLTALAAGLDEAEDPPGGYASDVLAGARDGADLILAERYVGTLLRVAEIPDARSLLVGYPEIARALGHTGEPPWRAAERIHRLYREHGEQVLGALTGAFQRASEGIVRWRLPANCLLGVICGRSRRSPAAAQAVGAGDAPPPPAAPRLEVDPDRFEARLGRRRCELGNTMEFRLLAWLAGRPGAYVSVEDLAEHVWGDDRTEKNTIQRTVSNLRRRLRAAGIDGLDIDGRQPGHYRLLGAA
jgi:hypothetical protein